VSAFSVVLAAFRFRSEHVPPPGQSRVPASDPLAWSVSRLPLQPDRPVAQPARRLPPAPRMVRPPLFSDACWPRQVRSRRVARGTGAPMHADDDTLLPRFGAGTGA
jgi:hypothetical protein